MNLFGLFWIGRNGFVFHLDGELNRDGWHRFCMSRMRQLLLEMAKPCNDMFFISFVYFDCTENTVRLWIRRMKWKINIFSISFTLVFVDEEHEETEEEYEELVRRIHFVTSEEGTLIDAYRRSLVWFCLSMMKECNILKAFRITVANKSEGDIMEHVLVFEMFQRFSNTQTYLNKQTMSWCKDFLWRHVFWSFFVKLTERCQHATPHLFCVKEVTRQQGT